MSFKGAQFLWTDRKRFLGMPLSFTRYALSEDRLFLSVGFLSVKDEEIILYRVKDISVRRTLWQRMFGVGTVIIASADKTTPLLHLINVKNPMDVKEILHENVEEMKLRRRMRPSEMVANVDHNQDRLDEDEDFDFEEDFDSEE